MPEVDVRLVDVVKKFGDFARRRPHQPRGPRRRVLQPPRPVGLRQDDDPPDDRRVRAADVGPDRAPGPGRDLAAALQAQRQHGLPELRPVPPPDDLRERRVRAAPPQGVKDSEIKSRVTEMLSLVELPGYERRKPTQISGGQAQRVALARALINRPAVLLLDEPLGALDLKLRKQMQVELKRIQQEVGITFIYVTHDQEEAMTMSESHRRHEPGPVRAAGRPREPLRAPDDPLRRRLPRRQQPAAGDDRRPGRRLRPRPARRRRPRPRPARPRQRPRHDRGRRPAREDPAAQGDRGHPGGRQRAPGTSSTPRTSGCRRPTWSSRGRGRGWSSTSRTSNGPTTAHCIGRGKRSDCHGRRITPSW